MKFLCDRCKTRYAIADERVRGKILKIRCKNCSAVITVREGMDESGEATAAAPVPPSEPQAAPPPAALQEEWYVSRDGAQEGPFTLTEAQAWIAARGPDDELFCWNEGFDDWLPVEKVSHFRGLRGAPPRTRATTRPGIPKEPEPQPLFAATLAAIEAEAAADAAKAEAKPIAVQIPAARTPQPSHWGTPTPSIGVPPIPESKTPVAGVTIPTVRGATPATGVPAIPAAARAAGPRPATPATGTPAVRPATPATGTPAAGPPSLPKLEPAGAQPPRSPLPSPFGLAPSVQKPNPFAANPAALATTPAAMNLASSTATNPSMPAGSAASSSPIAAPAAAPAEPIAAAPPPAPTPIGAPPPNPFPPDAGASPNPVPSIIGAPHGFPPAAAAPPAWSAPPPVAAQRPAARFDTGDAEAAGANAAALDRPAPPPPAAEPNFGGDDLDIGEVSRVVRLADLGRGKAPAKPRQPTAAMSAIGRGTGAAASIATPGAEVSPPPLDLGASMSAPAVPRRGHRTLYVALALGAVAIGVVAVIALGGGGDEPQSNETTGGTADYGDLGYRPSDPSGKRPPDPLVGSGSGTGSTAGSGKPIDRNPGSGRRPQGGSQTGSGSGTGTGSGTAGSGSGSENLGNPALPELSADDVFAMSARMESGTRRCYERAMKDDPFLKVSKIKATISVSAAGPVSSVTLSSMANTPLGTCLVAAIKRWPFKPSKDGIVSEFALVFEQK